MKIGITGATGFIGAHLLNHLSQRGSFEFKALVRSLHRIVDFPDDSVEWQIGDLGSSGDCCDFVRCLDVVIHLAHTNTPLTSNRDLAGDARANLLPSLNLLQAIKECGRKIHFIYASSGGAVYGRVDDILQHPFSEDDPCFPVTSYGIQKLAFESYLRVAANEGVIDATVLRIGNPYGAPLPPERMQGLIGIAVYQTLRNRPLKIIGRPENVRDYVHLTDVCLFVERILRDPNGFRIFNVSSGEGLSVNELLVVLENLSGRVIQRETIDYPDSGKHLVPWIVLSIEKARSELGWSPTIALTDGLGDLYARSLKLI